MAGVIGGFLLQVRPLVQILSFGAVIGGLLCLCFSIGGLIRVRSEQRSRQAMQRALAEHPDASRWEE